MTVRNQKKAEIRTEKYSREQEIKNTKKMREILEDLPGFCRQYFRGIEESTGARTRLAYAYDLRVFFEFIQRENPSLKDTSIRDFPISILERIGREDIEEYLDFLTYYEKDGQVFTNDARGKARKLSAVRSLFKYFYTSEILTKDVTALVPLPKLHEKPIVRLDSDEVAKMLMKADSGAELTRSQQRFHDKTRLRDMAILTLLLGTGIRVSECVGLDLDDLDFREKGMLVHRKGGSESIVYFGDEVEAALKDYLEQRKQILPKEGHEKALFLSLQNRRITVRAVENLVKKYAGLATSLKKITPHKLRSTYGTSLYRETGDIYLVADVLGHKDVNTTRKHYAAIDEDRRKSARNIVRLRNNKPDSAHEPDLSKTEQESSETASPESEPL
ncbi:Site-specific recombinase XerD [Sarcina sp. DSM 11001]|uniref:tyrosine-type recombinase/integrase n=1 Tax=Sarcina sp. DSM 11001 TaxID=1798184 RepID=UPI00088E63C8|nr:Site-specific recombinase XerD [Sarcina sp. DSM 11001]